MSASAKWTKGPWCLDETLPFGIYSDDATGSIIARVSGKGFEYVPRPEAEWQANARLIAAAPDFADAAEETLAFLNRIEGHGYGATAEFENARRGLQIALAKAQGAPE
jgi:hypothetical protein